MRFTTTTQRAKSDKRASGKDWSIRQLLRDEEGFLRNAGVRELALAVLYFRDRATKATTPQMRDFYLDRANQFAFRNAGLLSAPTRH